jgi:hypothetical protein
MSNFKSKTVWFQGFKYKTVQSPTTGRIWLDRNLGTSDTDVHGGYFKFGEALCPDGYEIPTDKDWSNELPKGGDTDLAWLNINLAGFRSTYGKLHSNDDMAYLWSSSELHGNGIGYRRYAYSTGTKVFSVPDNKESRFNVRLIKQ